MRNWIGLVLGVAVLSLSMAAAESHKDGYSFKNGKVVMLKGGQESVVTAEVSFNNGSRLLPDGFIVYRDGRRERFEESRWFTMDGDYDVVVADADDFDGYYYENGRVYVMRDRRPELVTVEITLNDGLRISPDGFIIQRDGTRNRF